MPSLVLSLTKRDSDTGADAGPHHQGAAAHQPTSRFLRGWALFEKRQGCYEVHCRLLLCMRSLHTLCMFRCWLLMHHAVTRCTLVELECILQ